MVSSLDNILQLLVEHSRKIATAISVVLIILMSLSVANSVLFVMEAADPVTKPKTEKLTTRKAAKPNYKVSSLELFGKTEAVNTTPQVIDAPETKLNLELQGVFIAEDENQSKAIVGEKNKAGELFKIGDRLPGNATLAAVFVDHVLIRRGARMEKLMFSDSKFRVAKSETVTDVNAKTARNIPGTSTTRSNLEKIRDRIRNRSQGSQTNPNSAGTGNALNEYKEKLKNDPVAALGELGVAPVADGESKGYRVGEDAQSAIRQAGLQPGDVILSVNGRPVGAAANDSALIDQVMASSRVRVEVQRGARRFFLTVPVPK